MSTIYLNMKTSQGVETVDEFTKEDNQTYKEFRVYVNQIVKEYQLGGMSIYKSQRSTNDWKNK